MVTNDRTSGIAGGDDRDSPATDARRRAIASDAGAGGCAAKQTAAAATGRCASSERTSSGVGPRARQVPGRSPSRGERG